MQPPTLAGQEVQKGLLVLCRCLNHSSKDTAALWHRWTQHSWRFSQHQVSWAARGHRRTAGEQKALQAAFLTTAQTYPSPDQCQQHKQITDFQRWFSKLWSTSTHSKKSLRQLKDDYPVLDCSSRSVNITQLTHSSIMLRQQCEKDKPLCAQPKSHNMLTK